ncbi:MAG: protein kinase domain-containing protein [Nakamurella sp.]
MKTVAHSLKILHDLHIVHSDLKPSNVKIKKTELGYTTKLIDFDSWYVVGSPPPPDEIVGTMNYYSPELITYVQGRRRGSHRGIGHFCVRPDLLRVPHRQTAALRRLRPRAGRRRVERLPAVVAAGCGSVSRFGIDGTDDAGRAGGPPTGPRGPCHADEFADGRRTNAGAADARSGRRHDGSGVVAARKRAAAQRIGATVGAGGPDIGG